MPCSKGQTCFADRLVYTYTYRGENRGQKFILQRLQQSLQPLYHPDTDS